MSFGTLYTHNSSPQTSAILAIAYVVGVKLNVRPADKVDAENYATLSEINAVGQVPIFVGSDGWILRECIPISLYIASQCDSTTLLGCNRREYYEVVQWMSTFDTGVLPSVSGCILPLLGQRQVIRHNVQDCIHSMYRHFKMLDDNLADREYLVGDDLTAADLLAVAILAGAYKAFHPVLVPDYKNMTHWFNEVYNLPVYKIVMGELDLLDLDHIGGGANTPP